MRNGAVLGVDVGFSPIRRSSAVCRLDWDDLAVRCSIKRFRAAEPERTETLASVACPSPVLVAALDGPLRGDLAIIGRYRTAERMLTRRLAPLIGKPGQASAPVGKALNEHTNECCRILLRLASIGPSFHLQSLNDHALVEAFPSAFLGVLIEDPAALGARRGDRSDTFYQAVVETGQLGQLFHHLLPGRSLAFAPSQFTNHDDRAALVCAITALCVAVGDYTAVPALRF